MTNVYIVNKDANYVKIMNIVYNVNFLEFYRMVFVNALKGITIICMNVKNVQIFAKNVV